MKLFAISKFVKVLEMVILKSQYCKFFFFYKKNNGHDIPFNYFDTYINAKIIPKIISNIIDNTEKMSSLSGPFLTPIFSWEKSQTSQTHIDGCMVLFVIT